jgi:hypothetical protein
MRKLFTAPLIIACAVSIIGCGANDTAPASAAATPAAAASPAATATSATSRSSDDKHKLFQAASMTGDSSLIMDMYQRIGLAKSATAVDADAVQKFTADHQAWVQSNIAFIQEVADAQKARDFYEKHK